MKTILSVGKFPQHEDFYGIVFPGGCCVLWTYPWWLNSDYFSRGKCSCINPSCNCALLFEFFTLGLSNWASKEPVGDVWSELSFFSCTTSRVLESIEHDFIKAIMIYPQPNSDLAQLAEHGTGDLEVVSSNPTGDNFWRNLFCSVEL